MYVVGLTGGIGSGKSTVANIFSELGIQIVDADISARAVVAPGSPALKKIAVHFGKNIILTNGDLDRKGLRAKVFNNEQELKWLERLLHPLIRQHIEQQLQNASSAYTILESPLLLETNQHEMTDRILVIDVPQDVQIARALRRDNSNEKEIRKIMSAQCSRESRLAMADDIIVNDQKLESLTPFVQALHQQYLNFAKDKP